MNISQAFASAYLKSSEISGDTVLTITRVTIEPLGQGKDKEEKPIIYFQEIQKGVVLNKTNSGVISDMYGPETDGWIGKRICIYPAQVEFQGKQVMAIRVRIGLPGSQPQRQPSQTTQGPSIVQMRDAAKNEAWVAWKASHIGTSAAQAKGFTSAFRAYFGGKDKDSLGLDDWRNFKQNGFVKPVTDNPLDSPVEDAVDDLPDIPF